MTTDKNPAYTHFELQLYVELKHQDLVENATRNPIVLQEYLINPPFKNNLTLEEYRSYVVMIMTKILAHNEHEVYRSLFDIQNLNEEQVTAAARIIGVAGEHIPWVFANFFKTPAGQEFLANIKNSPLMAL